MKEVLLLNRDGTPLTLWPLSTISWKQAIKAFYLDKVKILRSYDDWLCHSQHLTLNVPSVVMMSNYHYQKGKVNFTRRNIFLRDRFHCQYCQRHFSADNLTIDHVIPKSRGGGMRWINVVTACQKCNFRKGNKILRSSGLSLKKMPSQPSTWQLQENGRGFPPNFLHQSWRDYLYWDTELEKD